MSVPPRAAHGAPRADRAPTPSRPPMSVRRTLPALVATLAGLAACDLNEYLPTQSIGGGGGGAGIGFDVADATGDLLPGADPATAPDVVRLAGTVGTDTITIRLTFATPVARFSAGLPNSLDGMIEIDADENSNTGIEAAVNRFGGSSTMGVDYYVLLSDVSGTQMELVTVATSRRTRIPATFTSTVVTLHIPRALLATTGDRIRIAGVVGTPDGATDLVPDAGDVLVRLR